MSWTNLSRLSCLALLAGSLAAAAAGAQEGGGAATVTFNPGVSDGRRSATMLSPLVDGTAVRDGRHPTMGPSAWNGLDRAAALAAEAGNGGYYSIQYSDPGAGVWTTAATFSPPDWWGQRVYPGAVTVPESESLPAPFSSESALPSPFTAQHLRLQGFDAGGQGGWEVLSPSATVTPEPMTLSLLASGLAGIGVARRRRRKSDDAR